MAPSLFLVLRAATRSHRRSRTRARARARAHLAYLCLLVGFATTGFAVSESDPHVTSTADDHNEDGSRDSVVAAPEGETLYAPGQVYITSGDDGDLIVTFEARRTMICSGRRVVPPRISTGMG